MLVASIWDAIGYEWHEMMAIAMMMMVEAMMMTMTMTMMGQYASDRAVVMAANMLYLWFAMHYCHSP